MRRAAIGLGVIACVLFARRADADCNDVAAGDASFGTATSFAVRTTQSNTSTTNAGLNCSGTLLTVFQSNDHIFARLQSANGGMLGPGGDVIPYSVFADSARTVPIAFGVQFDYVSETLLNLLGLFAGPSTNLPMFFTTVTGANVAAGSYTDTITIQWEWSYCEGIGLLGLCIGLDTGSGSSSFDVTMSVDNACQITSTPDVHLGQAPTASQFAPTGQSVAVVCTKNLSFYTVGLSAGDHFSGGHRRMEDGGAFLEYDIFRPGGGVWGNVGSERVANEEPGHGVDAESFEYTVDVYDEQPTPPVGVYTDVVVVDVSF
ncbi:MAG: spore coat protein U domain-containing protein [Vicinamibacterales bacterium]